MASSYREASGQGAEHRTLVHLEITAGETKDGEKCWVVSKNFESQHHAPEETVFGLDEGADLLEYVADCLNIDERGYHHSVPDDEESEAAPQRRLGSRFSFSSE